MKSTYTLNLDELVRLTPNISPIQCSYFAEAYKIAGEAFQAQQAGNATKYLHLTKKAYKKEREAAWLLFSNFEAEPTRSVLFRSAAWLAFNYGKMREAEQLISTALAGNPPLEVIKELRDLYKEILSSFEPVHS